MDKKIITLFAVYVLLCTLFFINSPMSYFLIFILLGTFLFYYLIIEKDVNKSKLNKESYQFMKFYIYYRFILKDNSYLKLCIKNLSKETQKQLLNLNGEKEVIIYLKDLYKDILFDKFVLLLSEKKININSMYNLDNYLSSLDNNYVCNKLFNLENRVIWILIYDLIIFMFHYLTFDIYDISIKNQLYIMLIIFYIIQLTLLIIEYCIFNNSHKKNKKSFIYEYMIALLFFQPNVAFEEFNKNSDDNYIDGKLIKILKDKDKAGLIDFYNNEKNKYLKEIILFIFKKHYLSEVSNDDPILVIKYLNYLNTIKNNDKKKFDLTQLVIFGLFFIIQFYMMVTYGL